ncbi:unnamed protein product [Miscanthus lutarioriparius]|uniref:Uncharacterized protein n=1 Tax=Miscanthus lutarioriparius TaxID=422564 RepID=A0A811S300_9POAL|nr:unnamed protein product [Miscanthus lutarioriparius]
MTSAPTPTAAAPAVGGPDRANRATAAGTGEKGKRARAAGAHEDWDSGTSHRSRPVSLLGQPPADPERIEKLVGCSLKNNCLILWTRDRSSKQWIGACSVKRCNMPLCNGAIRKELKGGYDGIQKWHTVIVLALVYNNKAIRDADLILGGHRYHLQGRRLHQLVFLFASGRSVLLSSSRSLPSVRTMFLFTAGVHANAITQLPDEDAISHITVLTIPS